MPSERGLAGLPTVLSWGLVLACWEAGSRVQSWEKWSRFLPSKMIDVIKHGSFRGPAMTESQWVTICIYNYIYIYIYEPGSKLLVLGMVIQPLIGNPYNGYIKPLLLG